MRDRVLVVAETKDGKMRNVSFEVITAARRVANGGEITAVLLGSDKETDIQVLGEYGAESVYTVNHQDPNAYAADVYFQALHQIFGQVQPKAVFMPHTALGKEVAPRIAARLGLGLVSDVTQVEFIEGQVIFSRPIYAGKAFERRKIEEGIPFATIRPNNIPAEKIGPSKAVAIAFTPEVKDLRMVVKEVVRKTAGKVDLSEAKVVISGGRGVKSAEGFKPLQELADLFGGAVGASRGACDAGYCDYSLQIGQTGKVITPDLYIAAGISGAIQHLAGMSNSKVVVAINKDPEAPIFQVADYGIVGDLFEVIPLLTQELRKVMAD